MKLKVISLNLWFGGKLKLRKSFKYEIRYRKSDKPKSRLIQETYWRGPCGI